MPNNIFFNKSKTLTLGEILAATKAKSLGNYNHNLIIEDLAPLGEASEKQLSFLINSKYLPSFIDSKAGFCFCSEKYAKYAPTTMKLLIHDNPYKAYAIAANLFYPQDNSDGTISSTAVISSSAKIGKNCQIGNFVVIEDNVVIGNNSIIDHNTIIKKNVIIGNDCRIASNVTIAYTVIGNNVMIHPGCKIGQDGFGFASDHTGHLKVPQLGIVKIGNFVEIGANTTIDRGSAQDTEIGDMCQIDNLVQIGHNVKLGKACVVVAQVGIAGSSKLGNFVVLGGQVGVAGHLNIGNQVQVAAQSGIAQDVEDKQIIGGSPAIPIKQWHRQTIYLKQLVNKSNKHE